VHGEATSPQLGTSDASVNGMTPLAITTTYARPRTLHPTLRNVVILRQLQQYVGAHGWTLGTVLARTLLAIMTVLSGKRDVGAVLFGRQG
jgi:hypothetical protein